jgi:hypothetical protein
MRRALVFTLLYFLALCAPGQVKTVPDYDLAISADFSKEILSINGSISFQWPQTGTRDSVQFFLHQTMGEPSFYLLSGTKKIKLKYNRMPDAAGHYTYTIALPSKGQLTGSIKVFFTYEGGSETGSQFYFSSQMVFAGGSATAWYPQLISVDTVTHSGTLLEGTGKFSITVASPYLPLISGATQLVSEPSKKETYVFQVSTPTFFTLCIGAYKKYETLDHDFLLQTYLLSDTRYADYYLKNCSAIIDYLGSVFGTYPYKNFSIIEITDEISNKLGMGGGSTLGGIIMPSSSLAGNFNLALYGHELSHQWWGNKVQLAGTKGNGMLDEAMAQFGGLLTAERFDTTLGAESFRRKGYPGYINNQCGFGYLNFAASGQDEILSALSSNAVHTMADSKGFLVYDILAEEIGRDAFYTALKKITATYSHISWDEFLREIEKAAGKKLSWFYDQWFDRKGAPEWNTIWKQTGDSVKISIREESPYYRINNLEVEIISANSAISQKTITIDGERTEVVIPVDYRVREVKIDPYFKVLHWDKEYKDEIMTLLPATLVQNERIYGSLDKADSLYTIALKQLPSIDKYGFRFILEYEAGRIKTIKGDNLSAIAHFTDALQLPVRRADLLPWAYYRLAELAKKTGNNQLFEKVSLMAVNADAVTGGSNNMKAMIEKLADTITGQ